jgi:hypothetical protein
MPAHTKLTREVRDEIVRRLASGCTLEVAAEAAGVHRVTASRWLATGREAEAAEADGKRLTGMQRDCLELLRAEQTARAEVRVKALAAIQKAALAGTWPAAAWLLERLFPDEYAAKPGRKDRAGTGRPVGASSAPDRVARPGVLRAVK